LIPIGLEARAARSVVRLCKCPFDAPMRRRDPDFSVLKRRTIVITQIADGRHDPLGSRSLRAAPADTVHVTQVPNEWTLLDPTELISWSNQCSSARISAS
jgi:hypothetical protein